MAKDPKNFTGEDVPALLAAARESDRDKGEWSLLGHTAIFIVGAILLIGGVVGLIVSLFR